MINDLRLHEIASPTVITNVSREEAELMARELLALRKVNQWIKCEDRMPLEYLGESEVFRSVEVIVTDGETVGTCECQAGNGPKPWVAFSSYGDVKGTDITHWQPLPSPPTE